MKKITLLGNPISTGSIYRYACRGRIGCMYMTTKGKDLKLDYAWQARSQWHDPPLSGEVELYIILYMGTKRKSDWDNFHKISMDALTGIVWQDDSQVKTAHVYKRYDKDNPRIELEIFY